MALGTVNIDSYKNKQIGDECLQGPVLRRI